VSSKKEGDKKITGRVFLKCAKVCIMCLVCCVLECLSFDSQLNGCVHISRQLKLVEGIGLSINNSLEYCILEKEKLAQRQAVNS
jgi:hypothetical protein